MQVNLRHLSCARSFIAHKALYWYSKKTHTKNQQRTFWSLIRGSSLLRYKVIDDIAFSPFSGHLPDLRGHRLTQDLELWCRRFRLEANNTLFLSEPLIRTHSGAEREGFASTSCALKDGRNSESRRGLKVDNHLSISFSEVSRRECMVSKNDRKTILGLTKIFPISKV